MDNTPEREYDWNQLRLSLQHAVRMLPHFLKNPIDGMRQLPDWDWPTLLILEAAMAALFGCLKDIVAHHYLGAIVSIFVFPVVALSVTAVLAGFFFYTFMFFFKRHAQFRRIFTILLYGSIPVFAIYVLVPIVDLIQLVGVAAAGALVMVGFISNFDLPPKKVRNLILGMFIAYAALLIFQTLSWHGSKERFRERATPESLDILEKELKTDSTLESCLDIPSRIWFDDTQRGRIQSEIPHFNGDFVSRRRGESGASLSSWGSSNHHAASLSGISDLLSQVSKPPQPTSVRQRRSRRRYGSSDQVVRILALLQSL